MNVNMPTRNTWMFIWAWDWKLQIDSNSKIERVDVLMRECTWYVCTLHFHMRILTLFIFHPSLLQQLEGVIGSESILTLLVTTKTPRTPQMQTAASDKTRSQPIGNALPSSYHRHLQSGITEEFASPAAVSRCPHPIRNSSILPRS